MSTLPPQNTVDASKIRYVGGCRKWDYLFDFDCKRRAVFSVFDQSVNFHPFAKMTDRLVKHAGIYEAWYALVRKGVVDYESHSTTVGDGL